MLISAVTHCSLLYLQFVSRTEQWNAVLKRCCCLLCNLVWHPHMWFSWGFFFCAALHNCYYHTCSLIFTWCDSLQWKTLLNGSWGNEPNQNGKVDMMHAAHGLPLTFLNTVCAFVVPGTCIKCNKEVYGANQACQAMGNLYHDSCFTCSACSKHTHTHTLYFEHSPLSSANLVSLGIAS